MFLSVLIPVFDGRVHLLEYTLQSIKKQSISIESEIIILNDGTLNNGSEELAKKYNTKYIFSGHRNVNGKIYWRTAGYAFNIGVKQCKGDLLLFQEPEVFHLNSDHINKLIEPHLTTDKIATHPEQVYIDTGVLLDIVKKNQIPSKEILSNFVNNYHCWFWYSLCMKKQIIYDINGFSESEMPGSCYDDADFYERLINYGIKFISIKDLLTIHLFHPRTTVGHHDYNKIQYEKLKGTIIRNQNHNWGTNEWINFFND
jgi:glycosyltransferase involved in cell wall biosynthesis